MKWFKHDTNATQDAKIKKLLIRYGATGYAIYFHCLELIAGNVTETNLTFELEHDSEIIADNLRIKGTQDKSGMEIAEEIMRYIVELGLFEQSGDRIFCFKLLKRLDASMASDRLRKVITDARASHDIIMIKSTPSHDSIMLEENRREEKRIDEKIEKAPAKPSRTPTARFVKPTLEEVSSYCKERRNSVNPEKWIAHYEANGWKVGKNPMKDWKAAVRTWEEDKNKAKPMTQSWIDELEAKQGAIA